MFLKKIISLFLILFLSSCFYFKSINYSEITNEEKKIYDSTFNREIKKGKTEGFAHMASKEAVKAKRASDWIHK
jgi:hypothetical protein